KTGQRAICYESRLRPLVGRSRTRKRDKNFQGNRADAFRFQKLHWIARKTPLLTVSFRNFSRILLTKLRSRKSEAASPNRRCFQRDLEILPSHRSEAQPR